MKKGVFTIILLVGIVTTVFAMISGISGNWIAKVKLPDREVTLRYTLKSENGKLTGVAHGQGYDFDILDGVVKGDSLYFYVVSENGSDILSKGKYFNDGDSISLNFMVTGSNTIHTVLNRDTVGKR